jgi:hypothetical protein
MTDSYARARDFIRREARVLDQRLFETIVEGASPDGVVDALRAYRNADGGFGHGLEPDVRCPASLPVYVEVALQDIVAAKATDERLVASACDYLSSVSDGAGAVALAGPVVEAYPHASHWDTWTYQPGLNPTAGIAGLLHALHVDHPWLDRATAYSWEEIEAGVPGEAHAISEVFVFLEHVPDRQRADATRPVAAAALDGASSYRGDPDDPGYGLTPLNYAPTPQSPARSLFADDLIERHLDRLQRDQQSDGGWPITWEPPGVAPTQEWRAIETMRALRVLDAYGRLRS